MSDAKQSIAILQRISEFLADIPEEHLSDIAEGKARLTFIPVGASEPRRPATKATRTTKATRAAAAPVDMSEARAALAAMTSRDEGAAYLNRLRVPELKDLAASLGHGRTGTKPELIDRIVQRTIGSRLNAAAIHDL
jgi:hypothetical protein